jgi:DNA modification methylase
LQLGVIERAIKLWSNPGDVVHDPFTGIGSTGWVALRLGRQFKGGELKPSYFKIAVRNLQHAEKSKKSTMLNLFQEKTYAHHEERDMD